MNLRRAANVKSNPPVRRIGTEMFKGLSVGKWIVALMLLGTGTLGLSLPSRAQMVEGRISSGAIQQAIEAAREASRKKSSGQTTDAKAGRPTETKRVQSAKQEKKPKSNQPQQATRNPSGVPPVGEQRFVPDEVVIELASSTTSQQIDALAQRFRLTRVDSFSYQLGGTVAVRLRIPDRRSVPTVIRALETDASVLFAQPNYLFALVEDKAPAAPISGETDAAQYVLKKINLAEAHQLARGGKVLVAVIDSGIDVAHPDLADDIADSFDAIGAGLKVHSHGTAIAGGIAAHGRLLGAAPAAQILAVRAFSGNAAAADGTSFAIMKGLDWAVLHGARAINMSFAGPQDPGIARGVAAAHGKGVVLVAAAGNKGASSPPLYPAADRNVIAVTSTDQNDQLPTFANRGSYVSVAAPGVDLLLLAPNDSLQRSSGTSFSAAYVTGIVALMLERKPDLSPDALRQALMTSAHHLGSEAVDAQSGGGLVDAYQAVLAVAPAAGSETNLTPAANR
jgi:subtilisin family serine protease